MIDRVLSILSQMMAVARDMAANAVLWHIAMGLAGIGAIVAGARCNLGLCELAHGIAQRVDVLAQLEVQARQVGKAHLVSPVEIW